jgi:hypothetical protein
VRKSYGDTAVSSRSLSKENLDGAETRTLACLRLGVVYTPARLASAGAEAGLRMGLLYIFGGFALFIAAGALWNGVRLRRLRRERSGKGFTRERFIEAFRDLGIPDKIPAAVYDYYVSRKGLDEFPLSPEDTFATIHRDDPYDIDDDARALVDRLGMLHLSGGFRTLTAPQHFSENPIATLRDMVLWLDWMRRNQPESVRRTDT